MIDEKKLIEDIEKEFDGVCVYDVSPSQAVNDFVEIVDRQPKVGEWISCSERLPEEDERVLITTKTTDRVYFGTYTKRYGFSMREGFICDDGFMWLNTALAWMPLPPAFKESEE